jgi:hypothetical protein
MLLLPWLAGVLVGGFRWLHIPLLVAWVSGYLATYYALLAVKTRRPSRYRAQLWVYGIPTVLLGVLVLALRPAVLWYAPAYAALRLMVFVCATVSGTPLAEVLVAFVVVTAYLVGTVLHVKALIRERADVRYRWASIACHLLAFVGAMWLGCRGCACARRRSASSRSSRRWPCWPP